MKKMILGFMFFFGFVFNSFAQLPHYGDLKVTGTIYSEALSATSTVRAASIVFSASEIYMNIGNGLAENHGKALILDVTNSQIIPGDVTASFLDSISNIADVSDTIKDTGWVLAWNASGSIWEATPASIPITALGDIGNVSDTAKQTNDLLVWSGSKWEATRKASILNALDDIGNVDTTGKSVGDVLYWTGSIWGATPQGSGGGGSSTLEGLSDVSIISSASGEYLIHDGTNWINSSFKQKLDDLSDIQLGSPSNGHVLTYDSTLARWKSAAGGSGTDTRSPSFIIAAVDSPDTTKADYVCDGTADEEQIVAAMRELPSTYGGWIHLLPGTYNIANQITIPTDYIRISGSGMYSSIIKRATGVGPIINLTTGTGDHVIYFVLDHLTLDGEKATYTTAGIDCLNGSYVSDLTAASVRFTDSYDFGISITYPSYGTVEERYSNLFINCQFDNCANSGVYLSNGGYVSFLNCLFANNTQFGIDLYQVNYCKSVGCIYSQNVAGGIYTHYEGNHIFDSNLIIQPSASGAGIYNNTIGDPSTYTNNRILEGRYGIYLDNTSFSLVTNNYMYSCTTAGIYVNGSNPTILNNTIRNCGNGINFYGDYAQILNNRIVDSTADNVFIGTNADYSYIDGNYLANPGTYQIEFHNGSSTSGNDVITNNYFYGNTSSNMIRLYDTLNTTFSNNRFLGTSATYYIYVLGDSTASHSAINTKFMNNTYSGSYAGIMSIGSANPHSYTRQNEEISVFGTTAKEIIVSGSGTVNSSIRMNGNSHIFDTPAVQANLGNIKNASFASANVVGDATVGGTLQIGADVSLSRSAADVLTTADSIISATHSVYGDVIIGNTKNQKQVFKGENNYYIANAAVYSNTTATSYNGILRIETPINVTGFNYYMPDIVIRGYVYGGGEFRYSIHFYYYESSFVSTSCQTKGACPTNVVNIGMKNNCITVALGTSSTTWGIFSVYVDVNSKSLVAAAKDIDFEGTYKIRMTTSNSDLSRVATISALSVRGIAAQGLVIGKMSAITSGYVLDVSGAAYVSGTIYGAGNISGATIVDRCEVAPLDSLSQVNTWKISSDVKGSEIDHDSLGIASVVENIEKRGFEIKDQYGNVFDTIDDKLIPAAKSKETEIQKLSEAADQIKQGIYDLSSSEYTIKEVTKTVEEKGRDVGLTLSMLSRAIQQISERLDKLEGK